MAEALKNDSAQQRTVLNPKAISLRHIKLGSASSPGAVQVLGIYYYPDVVGLNGKQGFQSGQYEQQLSQEGSFSLKFPNTVGQDGMLHRERFACVTDEDFRPGDEFIEIYEDKDLLFVGVPVSYELTKSELTINGFSSFWLLKKTREKSAGVWVGAPRDALEHYLSVWQMVRGSDFSEYEIALSPEPSEITETPDGRWALRGAETTDRGVIMRATGLRQPFIAGVGVSKKVGQGGDYPHGGMRIEAAFTLEGFVPSSGVIILEAPGTPQIAMSAEGGAIKCYDGENLQTIKASGLVDGHHTMTIEWRDRWVYFYFDGSLVTSFRTPASARSANVALVSTTSAVTIVEYLSCQILRPFLFNPNKQGDYQLPGAPPAQGLEGHYHLDQDIWAGGLSESVKLGAILNPLREIDPASSESGGLYQRRVDPTINFPSSTTWMPSGPPGGEKYSCRWVGAIYLDLSKYDYALNVTYISGCRIWIGKTRTGEEYFSAWNATGGATAQCNWIKAGNSGSVAPSGLNGVLSSKISGWYTIIIEFEVQGSGGLVISYERSDSVGTFQTLGKPLSAAEGGTYSSPASSLLKLSPLGVFQDIIQYDSHYDAFQRIVESFGYQWTEMPQSLESGFFPGYVEPKTRVGRDTAYVLDSMEGTDIANRGSADDVADALLAEAQGLGDPSQKAQTTLEVFNFPMEERLFVREEQESLSDLSVEALVLQRANSLLALHAAPWEEIAARPQGKRQLVDKFPLAGELAEFKWSPGDGLRLSFPEVLVDDQNPRQIQSVNWPITPDSIGIPTAGFKQRPRGFLQVLRKMLKANIAAQRNYQGQLAKIVGTVGGNTGGQSSDAYSRVGVPVNLANLAKATVVVQTKTDASVWTFEVNAVNTGVTFTGPGRFDVTPWAGRFGSDPRMFVRGLPGTGAVEMSIELLVRV